MKIALTLFLLVLLALGVSGVVDEHAIALHDEAFERAMISFGFAKALNALISMIQGTTLSLTPVGMGIELSVGEVLDPFNDMVERFSWIMLLASVSLGLQKLLLLLGGKLFMQVLLGVSIASFLYFIWHKGARYTKAFNIMSRVMLLMILLRFSAIAFVYTSELVYIGMLKNEYQSAQKVLVRTQEKLEQVNQKSQTILQKPTDKKEWYEFNIMPKIDALQEQLNISKKLKELEESLDVASKNIIFLITIFIVQSVLFPLLFLWIFYQSVKYLFSPRFELQNLIFVLNRNKTDV